MFDSQIPAGWNQTIAALPDPHLLQTRQWSQVKARVGWQPHTQIWGDPAHPKAAALLLTRTIQAGGFGPRLRLIYLPKGPLLQDWGDMELRKTVLDDLTAFARSQGAIFLKFDPDVQLGRGVPGTPESADDPVGASVLADLTARGFHYSDEQIQFRNTVLIDLAPDEDQLLARMKQKTRYNIRLGGRKGVVVRIGDQADLGLLYKMYVETAERDGFTIRGGDYYMPLWAAFMENDEPTCRPLVAEVEGQPVAAMMLFRFARRAYYLHGMSRALHRNLMPNYLLQWEAIRLAKSWGCTYYDLWGAPEVFDESDSMWGVFRFKRGLGGEVLRTLGAYDLPLRPNLFRLYTRILPRILDLMRRRAASDSNGTSSTNF